MNTDLITRILGTKGAETFDEKVKMFSVSAQDYQFKRKAYANTIANTIEINDMILGKGRSRKSFAGASVSASNLAGVSIYAGIMRSMVQSIAPIFSVQRNIDAPEQKIMYVDFYDIMGVNGDKAIVPNIGADAAWADQNLHNVERLDLTTADNLSVINGFPIVPKTFKAEVYAEVEESGVKKEIVVGTILDGGNGKFIATPGIIKEESSISYNGAGMGTSTVNVVFNTDSTYKFTKVDYSVLYDTSAEDEVNKAYGQTKYYDARTSPLLVPVERNVISDHAMAKQGIINNDELYANFVENEYTKAINQRVFNALIQGYTGDTYKLDLSKFSISSGFYDTIIRSFRSLLTQAENILAKQTYKGAKCTGYLASPEAVNVFDLMVAGDGWVKNVNSTYYKDIAGWYNDVPVVRCTDLGEGELMLTVRTEDGYIAPLFHSMFLAPTELPVVANYQNMTKYATGMYSMEGFGFSSSALCVKLKVEVPEELKLSLTL